MIRRVLHHIAEWLLAAGVLLTIAVWMAI